MWTPVVPKERTIRMKVAKRRRDQGPLSKEKGSNERRKREQEASRPYVEGEKEEWWVRNARETGGRGRRANEGGRKREGANLI